MNRGTATCGFIGKAIRFEKALGIAAATMLRMQAAHDLAEAELRADEIKVERWPKAA